MTREYIQHAIDIIYNQILIRAELICFRVLFPAIHSAQPAFS